MDIVLVNRVLENVENGKKIFYFKPFKQWTIKSNLSVLIPKCFVYLVPGCDKFVLVGDGICNDETNNAVCRFDGGDCCLDFIHSNCSECICYFGQICAANFHPLVGDGFCNDETNIGSCNYDGGDCCGMNQSNSQR